MYNAKKRLEPAREHVKKVQEAINRKLLPSYNRDLKDIYYLQSKKKEGN